MRAAAAEPGAGACCSFRLRLSGKDSAVWISPTATMNWPQPSRSAVTSRAETAGSSEISTATTRQAGFTRQPRLLAALPTAFALALAEDEQQASAARDRAPRSLLHRWRSSSATSALSPCKAAATLDPTAGALTTNGLCLRAGLSSGGLAAPRREPPHRPDQPEMQHRVSHLLAQLGLEEGEQLEAHRRHTPDAANSAAPQRLPTDRSARASAGSGLLAHRSHGKGRDVSAIDVSLDAAASLQEECPLRAQPSVASNKAEASH
jgi:hypothetical protein